MAEYNNEVQNRYDDQEVEVEVRSSEITVSNNKVEEKEQHVARHISKTSFGKQHVDDN